MGSIQMHAIKWNSLVKPARCDKYCYNYAFWVTTLFEEGKSTAFKNQIWPQYAIKFNMDILLNNMYWMEW